ncbi:MAG: histidinol dehydrogenase [Proteobacteria bacterium]|nr:histidinol dehydrogenase [Pseudomonadota bacterium]MDA0872818.1 histidinol dehydrogenase [Pseudomonadota bacterium]MDA1133765.1 histidinol dehydrogenase [Pseudomonadota bacterium]
MLIKTLSSSENNFKSQLKSILHVDSASNDEIIKVVNAIVDEVKNNGDKALLEFTNKLDGVNVKSVKELEITQHELDDSLNKILPSQKIALEKAAFRVADYHRRQITNSWDYRDEKGSLFGQKVTPIDRVGLYVPGGKAAYPSSVIMNAVPAKVAGVKELIMVVPTPKGDKNQLVLAAAKLSGVNRVFAIGGAQAVAALAFGTETIPQVDKIVGPGNAYVAEAKRKVFGIVGIDMIAGPSEILVICDGKTNPDWIAMDLFSQAEHDELAQSILICPDKNFINLVKKSMDKLIDQMMRKKIIKTSLEARGLFILVKDLAEAVEISNMIAPEHLELSVSDPEALADEITHAGAIFMGRNTCEAVGDYCAGPNHVLPTSGTARFSSPLGVYDFQKRSSLINLSEESASELGKIAAELALGEGLEAHALSAKFRIKDE